MKDYSPFGRAVDRLMRRKNMTVESLAAKAGIKRQTLVDAMIGKSNPQRNTRRFIFEALGVSAEFLFDLEQGFSGETQSELPSNSQLSAEILDEIRTVSGKIEGLPIFVARSIIQEYEINADGLSVGEIEQVLRQKAREYLQLKKLISQLQPLDPHVKQLQRRAMRSLEQGNFALAKSHLAAARKIDREAWSKLDKLSNSRKKSELETIKSQAHLFSLSFDYRNAAIACKEGMALSKNNFPELMEELSVDFARFLNLSANEKGGKDDLESAIVEISETLIPLLPGFRVKNRVEIKYRLADAYSISGYRHARNSHLIIAARIFRENVCLAREENLPKEEGLNSTRLGDCHTEMGLNRGSGNQIILGLHLMEQALDSTVAWETESDRGRALIRFGTSLANAALFLSNAELYEKAEIVYWSASEIFESTDEVNWGRAQWGVGLAKTGIGKLRAKLSCFDGAECVLNQALRVITKDRFPIDHATIIQCRGNAKMNRGLIENTVNSLKAAILDFDEALEVRSDDRFKLGKIKTIGNRAKTKGVLASRSGDVVLAKEAVQELEAEMEAMRDGYWKTHYRKELIILRETLSLLSEE